VEGDLAAAVSLDKWRSKGGFGDPQVGTGAPATGRIYRRVLEEKQSIGDLTEGAPPGEVVLEIECPGVFSQAQVREFARRGFSCRSPRSFGFAQDDNPFALDATG
jgi:hypothetical protein